ncbi:MAG: hypothetical protein DRP09_19215 [Candidatus Thorarchaeota archaeon]|nr:MAG: hypothetical protein DRP09_19215 [Candidatus Thorarchaeota archaeon]
MEYVTSRGFTLPESADEFASRFWFNLWRINLWPYRELVIGDILYWYESPSRCIVWKSRVIDVDRFFYDSKEIVQDRLKARFGDLDTDQPYFVKSPEQGYCLAWKVIPLQRVNLLKPNDLRFPGQGWLRVDNETASIWLNQTAVADDVTLDDVVPSGTLLERINQLNVAMADVSPERVCSVVVRTVRRDTQLVRALKELCEFRCQFPGCGVRIPKRDGGFYIEVAHIQAASQGGQSTIGNLLVLCPNHHKEFDYGDLQIAEQTVDTIRGELNGRKFEIQLPGASVIARSG